MSSPLHSDLAPSASGRWSKCTASVTFIKANEAILPKSGGAHADEGTQAHDLAAKVLTSGIQRFDKETSTEMDFHVAAYDSFVRGQMKKGDRLLVERRVPLFYLPTQKGTVDAGIIGNGRIIVDDLKYGVGTPVYAEENTQLAIYTESLIRELEEIEDVPDNMPVSMNIYQPRDRSDPNPIRPWNITRAELRDFVYEQVSIPAQNILAGRNLNFVAGPHCDKNFCPARGICKHYGTMGLAVISDEPVDQILAAPIALPEAPSLTREQRNKILMAAPAMKKFLEAVQDQEMSELLNGAEPISFKIVNGKSNRQWTNEAEVEQLLSNHLSAKLIRPPGEIVSPAAAEKLLKGIELSTRFENRFAELINKPVGKATMAPLDDKRPAIDVNVLKGLHNVDLVEEVI